MSGMKRIVSIGRRLGAKKWVHYSYHSRDIRTFESAFTMTKSCLQQCSSEIKIKQESVIEVRQDSFMSQSMEPQRVSTISKTYKPRMEACHKLIL